MGIFRFHLPFEDIISRCQVNPVDILLKSFQALKMIKKIIVYNLGPIESGVSNW